ncbi:MAG: acetate--CoA ligase family protein [archaeon]
MQTNVIVCCLRVFSARYLKKAVRECRKRDTVLLSFQESSMLLNKYKLPLVQSTVIQAQTPYTFSYPVVLKAFSPSIVHKTEKGAVVRDIRNAAELESARVMMKARLAGKNPTFVVQPQLTGVELILGMKTDPQFGKVIIFGVGGILVELFKDVTFRIAPLKRKDAQDMLQGIKAKKLLDGFRNLPAVDKPTLVRLLMKLSDLVMHEDIDELDLNPVIASGKNIFIVDARIIVSLSKRGKP